MLACICNVPVLLLQDLQLTVISELFFGIYYFLGTGTPGTVPQKEQLLPSLVCDALISHLNSVTCLDADIDCVGGVAGKGIRVYIMTIYILYTLWTICLKFLLNVGSKVRALQF